MTPTYNNPVIRSSGGFGLTRSTQPSGIDPSVVRFIVALVVVGAVIEVISNFSNGAAWILVLILSLGLLINNPQVSNALFGLGVSLRQGVK